MTITATAAILNGKTRWHFVALFPGGGSTKSLKTWASKRDAIEAGKREWRA